MENLKYTNSHSQEIDEIQNHIKNIGSVIELIPTKSESDLEIKKSLWESEFPGVVALDWDGTVTVHGEVGDTGKKQSTIWQEVKTLGFSEESIAEMSEHLNRWIHDTTFEGQIAWSDATYKVYQKEGVTRQKLYDLSQRIILRPKAIETIKTLIEKHHHICIISYGLKQPIEWILEKYDLSDKVTVYADTLKFDENDIIVGADSDFRRVVPTNKHEALEDFIGISNLQNDQKLIFVGDSVHDLDAMNAVQGIGIYLHHTGYKGKEIQYNALDHMIKQADLIAINQLDSSFEPVSTFINDLIS